MTDVLDDGILEVSVDMLSGIGIIVMPTPTITLEFVVRIAYAVDVLTDLLTVLIIEVVSVIGVDMLADEDANGLAAVISP